MTSSNESIFRVTGLRGIHRPPVNSPHRGQWREAFKFSLICASINGWVNNRQAGDLRRHRAHYDVTVMITWTPMVRVNWMVTVGKKSVISRLPIPERKYILCNELYDRGTTNHIWFKKNKVSYCTCITTHTSFMQLHDDVIKWKHFPHYWPFVLGIHRSQMNIPHKGQWVTRSFDVFFDLRLNKRLSKQSRRWWFETPLRPLLRQCNETIGFSHQIIKFERNCVLLMLTCWNKYAYSCTCTHSEAKRFKKR